MLCVRASSYLSHASSSSAFFMASSLSLACLASRICTHTHTRVQHRLQR